MRKMKYKGRKTKYEVVSGGKWKREYEDDMLVYSYKAGFKTNDDNRRFITTQIALVERCIEPLTEKQKRESGFVGPEKIEKIDTAFYFRSDKLISFSDMEICFRDGKIVYGYGRESCLDVDCTSEIEIKSIDDIVLPLHWATIDSELKKLIFEDSSLPKAYRDGIKELLE